jgi:hypothetical protein
VSKILQGALGCPAFDRYFQIGFRQMGLGPVTLRLRTLKKIAGFFKDNEIEIDAAQVPTLDFVTGQETNRRYARAKSSTRCSSRRALAGADECRSESSCCFA